MITQQFPVQSKTATALISKTGEGERNRKLHDCVCMHVIPSIDGAWSWAAYSISLKACRHSKNTRSVSCTNIYILSSGQWEWSASTAAAYHSAVWPICDEFSSSGVQTCCKQPAEILSLHSPAVTECSLLFLLLICYLALHPSFNKAACFILWGSVRCALSPLWRGRGVTQSQWAAVGQQDSRPLSSALAPGLDSRVVS